MSALTELTIAEARAGLDKRDFTARELTDASIAAAEGARDLNALVAETFDQARAEADASDKRIKAGDWVA